MKHPRPCHSATESITPLRNVSWAFAAVLVSLLLLPTALCMAGDLTVSEATAPLASTVGTSFTYQGSLRDGGALATGNYDLRFQLFDALVGGTSFGPTITFEDLPLERGSFTVQLDFGAAFDGSQRFLEIAVRPGASTGAFTILTPRQKVLPTPYAIMAAQSAWSGITGKPAGFADDIDNDTTYSAGTGLQLQGTTFRLPATTKTVPITVGDLLLGTGSQISTGDCCNGVDFADGSQGGGPITFPLPADYTPGTSLTLDLYVIPMSAGSGSVGFFARWVGLNNGSYSGTGASRGPALVPVGSANYIHKLTLTMPAFSGTLPELVELTIRRYPSDSYAGLVRLIGLRLSYTANG